MTETQVQAPPQTQTSSGDHDKFRHFFDQVQLNEAMILGTPIQALCGIVKVPEGTRKDLQVCPECKDIWENIPADDDNPDFDGNIT